MSAKERSILAKQGRPQIYPWDTWLDPSVDDVLIRRKKYQCTQVSMNVMIRTQAFRRGLKVSIRNNWNNGNIRVSSTKDVNRAS